MAGLALDPAERVGWAQILEAGTGWEQGLAVGVEVGSRVGLALPLAAAEALKAATLLKTRQSCKYCQVDGITI